MIKFHNILLFLLLLVASFSHQAYALDRQAERTIKVFLLSQESEHENAVAQNSVLADLNRDGKKELVLVWKLLGPTYWQNNLTIFAKTTKGYKKSASLQLVGEAKLSAVNKGIIYIEQVIYAKDDPKCCPSIEKKIKYRWRGGKIEEYN